MMKRILNWIERGFVPDFLIRAGIRKLLRQRLREELIDQLELSHERYQTFLQEVAGSPIAVETDKANQQHYEIPSAFFQLVLGQHKKYSCCYYQAGDDLSSAETRMLEKYLKRAQLKEGQDILELGCGWGSLTLFMASNLPGARITAISNSASQREYILAQAKSRGLTNLTIVTEDINHFKSEKQYDRIVSVEMFEHVRNYQQLFKHIGQWLKEDGLLFLHVFCHRHLMYPYQTEGDHNWMGRYFFSGGQMPAFDTFLNFQQHVSIEHRWLVGGTHYEKTANDWLYNMDRHSALVMAIFQQVYGKHATIWFQRWRIFFMSCAELFGFQNGQQWFVGHYLFSKHKGIL